MPLKERSSSLLKKNAIFITDMPKWEVLEQEKVLPIILGEQRPYAGSYLFMKNKVQRGQMIWEKLAKM